MPHSYTVRAVWDAQAAVWISDSNIEGLHSEAETLDAFEEVLQDVAADSIAANHITDADLDRFSVRELIPTILFVRPEKAAASFCRPN